MYCPKCAEEMKAMINKWNTYEGDKDSWPHQWNYMVMFCETCDFYCHIEIKYEYCPKMWEAML